MSVISPGLRSLPPRAARFCLGLERFFRKDLGVDLGGTSLVVAYSGGADSKALLLALHHLAPRLGLTLHAATLDHQLRPESGAECADAARVCTRLGITFHGRREDIAAHARALGMGVEEAGRSCRLAFLESVRQQTGSTWIATGHHLNDLAEDCLMRMIRGSGWPALAGMKAVTREQTTGGASIRPLLLTPRVAIERFLRDLGETWHEDASNADMAYFRNRVRHRLLPLFLEENPAFLETVADRWRMARDDEALLIPLLAAIPVFVTEGGFFLSREALENIPAALRVRKYLDVLARCGKGQAAAKRLAALDAAWLRGEGGKEIQFPGGKRARIREGGVLFWGSAPNPARG